MDDKYGTVCELGSRTRTGLRMGGEDRQMALRVRDTTTNLSADANSCPISTAYMRIRRPDIDMNEQSFGEKRNESFTETRTREIRRSISFGTRIQFELRVPFSMRGTVGQNYLLQF